jgi:hypothetical protein
MAFVYRYVEVVGVPPAPFVFTNLYNLAGTAVVNDRPARVDSVRTEP